ncbi:MAG TPA: hypothetical protein VHT02_05565 [Methylocella sp.]|jgi:hypothetical protein|nr:hypothetical protein [Methylocella sp.]
MTARPANSSKKPIAGTAATIKALSTKYQTRVSVDLLGQSGLRASTPTVANGERRKRLVMAAIV